MQKSLFLSHKMQFSLKNANLDLGDSCAYDD